MLLPCLWVVLQRFPCDCVLSTYTRQIRSRKSVLRTLLEISSETLWLNNTVLLQIGTHRDIHWGEKPIRVMQFAKTLVLQASGIAHDEARTACDCEDRSTSKP